VLEVSPSTDSLTIPLPSGNTQENLFRNWCGLPQIVYKSCLFLQEEATHIFLPLLIYDREMLLLMALVLWNQRNEGEKNLNAEVVVSAWDFPQSGVSPTQLEPFGVQCWCVCPVTGTGCCLSG